VWNNQGWNVTSETCERKRYDCMGSIRKEVEGMAGVGVRC